MRRRRFQTARHGRGRAKRCAPYLHEHRRLPLAATSTSRAAAGSLTMANPLAGGAAPGVRTASMGQVWNGQLHVPFLLPSLPTQRRPCLMSLVSAVRAFTLATLSARPRRAGIASLTRPRFEIRARVVNAASAGLIDSRAFSAEDSLRAHWAMRQMARPATNLALTAGGCPWVSSARFLLLSCGGRRHRANSRRAPCRASNTPVPLPTGVFSFGKHRGRSPSSGAARARVAPSRWRRCQRRVGIRHQAVPPGLRRFRSS
jgi:hypothetical protein